MFCHAEEKDLSLLINLQLHLHIDPIIIIMMKLLLYSLYDTQGHIFLQTFSNRYEMLSFARSNQRLPGSHKLFYLSFVSIMIYKCTHTTYPMSQTSIKVCVLMTM